MLDFESHGQSSASLGLNCSERLDPRLVKGYHFLFKRGLLWSPTPKQVFKEDAE